MSALLLGGLSRKSDASLFKSPVGRNRLRPPGAVSEEIFAGKCIRCGRCAEVCPYRCVYMLDIRWGVWAGTPLIFVDENPCYLCMKCVEVCPTGTLMKIKQTETRMGLAVINKRYCVTWLEQALCRSCYNACPFKDVAIKLERLKPVVVDDKCVGCGLCVHACPMNPKAINVEPIYSFTRVKWK
ncbi:MAG: 4Fe-4S dicluster domain-containing protein [Deferribacteres bacterium]|nr:4Fe-4S dicluster domain-containing protein [Deferribacteres bacterium]